MILLLANSPDGTQHIATRTNHMICNYKGLSMQQPDWHRRRQVMGYPMAHTVTVCLQQHFASVMQEPEQALCSVRAHQSYLLAVETTNNCKIFSHASKHQTNSDWIAHNWTTGELHEFPVRLFIYPSLVRNFVVSKIIRAEPEGYFSLGRLNRV